MAISDAEKDEAKGRVKEAAGKLTGDKSLQREGKVDRAAGQAKETVDKVKDAVTGEDTGTDKEQ